MNVNLGKGFGPLDFDENGKNIRNVGSLSVGDMINIRMLNGKVKANVREIEKNN